jgi:hypothetical protein
LLAAAAAGPARADLLLPVHNEGALARSFALPTLGDTEVLDPGQSRYRVALDWTNEYFADSNARESMTLDGETQRIALGWRGGVSPNLELGVQLPILITGSGILDGVIENYHNVFGFPDGGRDRAPHGRYLYQYQRNGNTVLHVDTGTVDAGDAELSAGWQLQQGLALRGMVKLPSGREADLTGGNPGGALWLDYAPLRGVPGWLSFLSAGGSYNGQSDVLSQQQHQWVAFGGAGLGYRLAPTFALFGQLYAHSQLYGDSDLKALRRDGLQLGIGVRGDLPHGASLTAGFQEDLITDSSPDISFHVDLAFR